MVSVISYPNVNMYETGLSCNIFVLGIRIVRKTDGTRYEVKNLCDTELRWKLTGSIFHGIILCPSVNVKILWLCSEPFSFLLSREIWGFALVYSSVAFPYVLNFDLLYFVPIQLSAPCVLDLLSWNVFFMEIICRFSSTAVTNGVCSMVPLSFAFPGELFL